MKVSALLLTLGMACMGGQALAAGDPVAGKEKSAACVACHAADGNSTIPTNPKLAGQYASYLEAALKAYRSGDRKNAIMAGFAGALSDQDIADLAAYFSSQKPALHVLEK